VAKEPTSTLYLSRLRIKNFRSIAELDVPINQLTILVGPNGSGKSNLVDALRFLRDSLTRGLDQALLDRGGFQALQRWTAEGQALTMSLGVTYASLNNEETVSYDLLLTSRSKQGATVQKEDLQTTGFGIPRFRMTRKGKVYSFYQDGKLLKSNGERTPYDIITTAGLAGPVGLSGIASFRYELDNIASESARRDILRYQNAAWRLTGNLTTALFYELHPPQFRKPQKLVRESPLDETGQNLAAVLRQLHKNEKTRIDIQSVLQRVAKEIEDFSVKPTGSYLVTYLHYNAGKLRKADLGQESDGTLRILAILAALYQINNTNQQFPFTGDERAQLITIEEPEAHLHPGMLSVLAELFIEVSQHKQLLLTTHSPDLLDYLPPESFLVVEKIKGNTQAGSLAPEQIEIVRQKLFTPGELLRSEGLHRATDDEAVIPAA
jgi:predicted ATPase